MFFRVKPFGPRRFWQLGGGSPRTWSFPSGSLIRLEPMPALGYDDSSYREKVMASAKIAITIDQDLLARLDRLVQERRFPNRSRAVQQALRDKLDRLERSRLARECAKLDPAFEQQLAEEALAADLEQWPVY